VEPGGTHLGLFLEGLAKCPEVSGVAIADPSGQAFELGRKLLGPHAPGMRTFRSHEEMLRAAGPALAIVTVEPHRNPPLVRAALEAGAHVLSEKPPSVRLADFEDLAKLSESRQSHLMLAMATRGNTAARKARELVARGWMGKLYGVTMNWIGDQTRLRNPAYRTSWPAIKSRAGGGKLAFHGVHYLDLIHYISGDRIARVNGFCRNVGGQPIEVEDAAVVALQFRRGMVGTLNAGYYLDRGFANLIYVWGESGWFRFEPFGPLEWYSTHPDAPRGVQHTPNPGADGDYDTMMRDVVRTAAGVGAPFMTTEESLSLVRVIFAAYRANESGESQTVARA
jgi:predicted dehydrogenase